MNDNGAHERWVAAVRDLSLHESDCSGCQVDRYCDEGRRLAGIEINAHWQVTHPGEQREGVAP